MLQKQDFTRYRSIKSDGLNIGHRHRRTVYTLVFTFRQSSPARNFCRRSGRRPPQSAAGRAACARPAGWTHLATCSRWVSTVPCPCYRRRPSWRADSSNGTITIRMRSTTTGGSLPGFTGPVTLTTWTQATHERWWCKIRRR